MGLSPTVHPENSPLKVADVRDHASSSVTGNDPPSRLTVLTEHDDAINPKI